MFKPLSIIVIHAFCSMAFAEIYSTSVLSGQDEYPYYVGEFSPMDTDVFLNVDKTVSFGAFDTTNVDSLLLNFVGRNSFYVELGECQLCSNVSKSITGDEAAVTFWESRFLSAAEVPTIIGLVLCIAPEINISFDGVTFMGKHKGESVTLGGSVLEYVGYYSCLDAMDDALAAVGDNQVAIAGVNSSMGDGGIFLVGKATPVTIPEPATAPLSLLALAGLSSRRRRK